MTFVVVQEIQHADGRVEKYPYPQTEKQIRSDAEEMARSFGETHAGSLSVADMLSFSAVDNVFTVKTTTGVIYKYYVREIGLIEPPGIERTENFIEVSASYPSELWWRSSDNLVAGMLREWFTKGRERGFETAGDVEIGIKLDKSHPLRMRTITVRGEFEK